MAGICRFIDEYYDYLQIIEIETDKLKNRVKEKRD
jgi:hypothetical protein